MHNVYVYSAYIFASRPYGTLDTGVTDSLSKRVVGHREARGSKFTKKYGGTKRIWFQDFTCVDNAIQREKSIKRWPRAWKINSIERSNPDRHDLFPAMQKNEAEEPLARASIEMGPGQLRRRPKAVGSAQDDT